MKEKVGIIDIGGGMRDIYGAGIFDYCLQEGITFDLGVGVSAGSAILASFLAQQRGRNHRFYTEYSFRKEYMSFWRFLRHRNAVDLDYVYGTLSNADGEDPLDYETLHKNPMDLIVVATNAETGKPHYFLKKEIRQDHYDIFKASSALPHFCRPVTINGVAYYDGAVSDCIPLEKAFSEGCDRVILILTKPEDTIRKPDRDRRIARHIQQEYPLAAKAFCVRAEIYNQKVELAKRYREEGKLLLLSPKDTFGVDTLRRDKQSLEKLYEAGWHDAEQISSFLSCREGRR